MCFFFIIIQKITTSWIFFGGEDNWNIFQSEGIKRPLDHVGKENLSSFCPEVFGQNWLGTPVTSIKGCFWSRVVDFLSRFRERKQKNPKQDSVMSILAGGAKLAPCTTGDQAEGWCFPKKPDIVCG